MKYCITCFLIFFSCTSGFAQTNENAIIGKWMTVQQNLAVEVYKFDNDFKARIIWFKVDDKTKPMNQRMDEKNPDKSLRTRKWLGMDVLKGLTYNTKDQEWEGGKIYDAKNGRTWDSIVWMTSNNLLKVKGYWVFKFISETLTFKKID